MADQVTIDRIINEYSRRKIDRSPLIEACRRITQAYNNEIAIPLPEMSAVEASPVANLITIGIDQHSRQIAETLPDIQCPAVKEDQKTSVERATLRRRACYGYWDQNTYELKMRKRARWLVAYATAPVWIRPDMKLGGPRWELRSPLNTYPSDEEMVPENVIFAHTRTVSWLRDNYPDLDLNTVLVPQGRRKDPRALSAEDQIEVIQWLDDVETVTMAVGVGYCVDNLAREAEYGVGDAHIINLSPAPTENSTWAATLLRTPNKAGVQTVICPGRISLDRMRGQFDDTIGLYGMQATLAAMEFNAIANNIWPDQWVIPTKEGMSPQVLVHANGRLGRLGQISGGQIITVQHTANPQTEQAINRLERGTRLSGSVPADMTGESPTNVRTARRGAEVLSAAVDPTIAEHQDILARSQQHELEAAAGIDVAYFGSTKKSFYVKWKGASGRIDYTPKEIWNDDRTIHVSYAKAGANSEQLAVASMQLVGGHMMSRDTGMRMHPYIADPEHEKGQILAEGLDDALLSSLQQGAASGQLAVMDVAEIKQDVVGGSDLETAVLAQQKRAQERQAQQVEPTAPEAQPGLSAPGAGAEAQGTPTIGETQPSVANLADLIRNIRTPAVAAGAA